jgi:hypothetical protein
LTPAAVEWKTPVPVAEVGEVIAVVKVQKTNADSKVKK